MASTKQINESNLPSDDKPLALRKTPRAAAGGNMFKAATVPTFSAPTKLDTPTPTIKRTPSVVLRNSEIVMRKVGTSGGVSKRKKLGSDSSEPPASKRKRLFKDTACKNQNDSYCWSCHKEGVLVSCEVCPRSFHLRCASLNKAVEKEWVCPECDLMLKAENVDTRSAAMKALSIDQLCNLLKFAVSRMKLQCPGDFLKPVPLDLFPNYANYIVHPMDLETLEKNIRKKMYGCTESFLADAKWILHNCIVFNGYNHKLTSVAKSLMKICKHEMNEIEVCPDCYHNAYTKRDNWFQEPCCPPHLLIWARLKGFPFWPAKAMRIISGNVDVRFFGAHDRAWIPISQCFLLSKDIPSTMKIKKKGVFEQSMEELLQHIQKLKDRFKFFEYAPFRTVLNAQDLNVNLQNMLPGVNLGEVSRSSVGRHNQTFRHHMPVNQPVIRGFQSLLAVDEDSLKTIKQETELTPEGQDNEQKSDSPTGIDLQDVPSSNSYKPRQQRMSAVRAGSRNKLESAIEKIKSIGKEFEASRTSKLPSLGKEQSDQTLISEHEVEDSVILKETCEQNLCNEFDIGDDDELKQQEEDICEDDNDDRAIVSPSPSDCSVDKYILKSTITINEEPSMADNTKGQSDEEESINDIGTTEELGENSVSNIGSKEAEKDISVNVSDTISFADYDLEEVKHCKDNTIASVPDEYVFSGEDNEPHTDDDHQKSTAMPLPDEASAFDQDYQSEEGIAEDASNETNNGCTETSPSNNNGGFKDDNQAPSTSILEEESEEIHGAISEMTTHKPLTILCVTSLRDASNEFDIGDGKSLTSHSEDAEKADELMAQDLEKDEVVMAEDEKSDEVMAEDEKSDEVMAEDEKSDAVMAEDEEKSDGIVLQSPREDTYLGEGDLVIDLDKEKDEDNSVSKKTKLKSNRSPFGGIKLMEKKLNKEKGNQASSSRVKKSLEARPSPAGEIVTPDIINSGPFPPAFPRLSPHGMRSQRSGIHKHQNVQRAMPALQPRPSPLQGPMVPRPSNQMTAGSSGLNKYSQKMVEFVRGTMEEMFKDLANTGNPEATIKTLQLEMEKMQWCHQQAITEMKHNTDLILLEMRNSMESEKQRIIAEVRRQCEIEKQRVIEEVKKKQWCAYCGKEAIFYCCWNTSYCDYPCQQAHWPQHVSVCSQTQTGTEIGNRRIAKEGFSADNARGHARKQNGKSQKKSKEFIDQPILAEHAHMPGGDQLASSLASFHVIPPNTLQSGPSLQVQYMQTPSHSSVISTSTLQAQMFPKRFPAVSCPPGFSLPRGMLPTSQSTVFQQRSSQVNHF